MQHVHVHYGDVSHTWRSLLVANKALISRLCQSGIFAKLSSILSLLAGKDALYDFSTLSVHCLSLLLHMLRTWMLITRDASRP